MGTRHLSLSGPRGKAKQKHREQRACYFLVACRRRSPNNYSPHINAGRTCLCPAEKWYLHLDRSSRTEQLSIHT